MTARAVAAGVLDRVLHGGAYSNVLLGRATAGASEEEAAATRAMVYGTLRWVGEARAEVGAGSARPIGRIQPAVLAVLLAGAHELRHRDAPAPAVVSAWVDVAKEVGAGRAAGFVNAVLRSVARSEPVPLTPSEAAGIPAWLVEDLGAEADAFLEASNQPARVGLRIPPGTQPPDGTVPVPGIPEAVLGDRPVPGLPVQDPASVGVVEALGVERGMMVVDLAAAPGGKAAHLVDLVGPDGFVVAGEVHERRLRSAASRVPGAHWVRADARFPPFARRFDRVLLDAPCSGLGTLRRRPEIRLRVSADDVDRLARLQREMLERALELVAPGGRLVYSVCTVTPRETVAVTEGLPMHAPEGLPGRPAGNGWLMAPHLGDTDGMFVAVAG